MQFARIVSSRRTKLVVQLIQLLIIRICRRLACAVAAHAGLRSGDVILHINGENVTSHTRACQIFNVATETKAELEIEYYPGSSICAREALLK